METTTPVETPATIPEQFHFTGKAGEYFGIWIVNLFLTIITLGIYSAWAKVRKKRYYYGNTWLAGSNFEYHGNPVAILKGRLIALAAFAAYTFAAQFSPHTAAIVAVVLLPAVPWLLIRSFAFNAVNSSYRNLRFHYRATYREAAVAIGPAAIVPLLTLVMPEVESRLTPSPKDIVITFVPLVALWFVYPYLVAKTRLLQINNSRFGTAPFACTAQVKSFYWVYFMATVMFVVMLGVLGAVLFGLYTTLASLFSMENLLSAIPLLFLVLYPVIFALAFGYTHSRIANLVFNRTTLDARLSFKSNLSARRLAFLFATNILAVVCTLGLAIPWAAMRNARYRAERLSAECPGGVELFLADVATHVSATGEEMGEMFDVDFSL